MGRATALLLAMLTITGCREGKLVKAEGHLRLFPFRLELGTAFLGSSVDGELSLQNAGRATLELSWLLPHPPFEVVEPPSSLEAGERSLVLRFSPERAGVFSTPITVTSSDGQLREVTIEATGLEPTPCIASGPCRFAVLDAASGGCRELDLPDGEPCEAGNACLFGASCQSGRCVGAERSCDDGDACTVDVCNAAIGCEHLPAPPCPGDGRCQLGVCDRRIGCTLVLAPDGTACGTKRGCDLAEVCILGACVERDPPDGFLCAPASPCQEAGRCRGSTCERPEAVFLEESWKLDSNLLDEPPELHDMVMEPDGEVSLMGFFEVPRLRVTGTAPSHASTRARRCILWNAELVCADFPYPGNGKVSAVEPGNGQLRWTMDFAAARPDLAAAAGKGQLFMARLAALGSDRLAALFEAYPAGAKVSTRCRLYFLAILDASGKLVAAQKLEDELLLECSHPHPFGVASDTKGNLFLAFSPSPSEGAPLLPSLPTLLLSYSREGLLRWKRTESFSAGELAVARGYLYPEGANVVFSTATGEPHRAATLPFGTFGRVVATADSFVPAPRAGAAVLEGYEAGTGRKKWTYSSPQQTFWSEQIRLASWQRAPEAPVETVALVFGQRLGQPMLLAMSANLGSEEWACPLRASFGTAPQLFEVSNGTLVVMEGADRCGACDPPFAKSRASFHRYPLKGVDAAQEPWTGTFGGPGHDHHEDAPAAPLALQ